MRRSYSVAELARMIDGDWEGDGDALITGVASLDQAKPGDVTFVDGPRWEGEINVSQATAIIVRRDLKTDYRPLIRTDNPRVAFIRVMELLIDTGVKPTPGVHATAVIGEDVQLGVNVSVMAHVTIDRGARIGDGVVISPGSCIGQEAEIGEESVIYANVTVGAGVRIGRRVLIHGSSSVGHFLDLPEGAAPQLGHGHTVLHDDVELGANCVVSPGTPQEPSVIGAGTKADNLVHFGASSRTGRHCVLVAQTSLGERAVLGDRVSVAGQATVGEGVQVGNDARIAARSVVLDDVPQGATYSGMPARDHASERRVWAHVSQLAATEARVARLERILKQESGSDPRNAE